MLLVDEARQASWIENDHGRTVYCVTNAVRIMNPHAAWPFDLAGVTTSACPSAWWMPRHVSVTFEPDDRPEIMAFEKEHAAFEALLPALAQDHAGRFVAVHNGVPVDSDASRSALVTRFFDDYGDVPVYIGYVGTPRPVYQLTPLRI